MNQLATPDDPPPPAAEYLRQIFAATAKVSCDQPRCLRAALSSSTSFCAVSACESGTPKQIESLARKRRNLIIKSGATQFDIASNTASTITIFHGSNTPSDAQLNQFVGQILVHDDDDRTSATGLYHIIKLSRQMLSPHSV